MGKGASSFRVDLRADDAPAPPCVVVVFGATGDLTARKIAPALYNLARQRRLHENTVVYSRVGRRSALLSGIDGLCYGESRTRARGW